MSRDSFLIQMYTPRGERIQNFLKSYWQSLCMLSMLASWKGRALVTSIEDPRHTESPCFNTPNPSGPIKTGHWHWRLSRHSCSSLLGQRPDTGTMTGPYTYAKQSTLPTSIYAYNFRQFKIRFFESVVLNMPSQLTCSDGSGIIHGKESPISLSEFSFPEYC